MNSQVAESHACHVALTAGERSFSGVTQRVFLDVGLGLELLLTVRAREGEFFAVRRFHVNPHVGLRHFGEVFIA